MLLNIFLFGIFFISTCVLISRTKKVSCFLEEAPETSLKGQFYPLATPILCLLEDIPESYLTGQSYHLATPLMTPFACIVSQTWQKFYRQHLRQLGVNYWQWKDKPEIENICPELSLLLTLPEPQGYAKQILECLARNNNPFLTNFSGLNPMLKARMRLDFKKWHDQAVKLIGIKKLKLIYEICYGTRWTSVPKIINIRQEDQISEDTIPWWQVLGVSPSAKQKQVEIAYKMLIKTWHPDLNPDPQATKITAQINVAYAEYKLFFKSQSLQDDQLDKVNFLFKSFLDIFKPLIR
jgi:hypothetical protein